MTSRTRLWVLAISTPIIAFALIGGYLGQAMTRNDTYQHLRVFEDVVSLVINNYVEPVDVQRAMRGAMRGLADGLDPDSAFLTPELVKVYETQVSPGPADIGLELTRQYYLRVISARTGSPGAEAGLRTGDYIRAIDNKPTRDMSTYEGERLLHGAPGSKVSLLVIRGNAADPHEMTLIRERPGTVEVTSRMLSGPTGYIDVVEFAEDSAMRLTQAIDTLTGKGASRFILDLRGTAEGDLDDGVAAARLFVKSGTLSVQQGQQREVVTAQAEDGGIVAPLVLLIDQGTSGAAEVFAAALDGHDRASLIGQHTLGSAGRQRLVHLPDGSGLLLTIERYLTPAGTPIHETGLAPDVAVDQPVVDFGSDPPVGDPTLDRALRSFTTIQATTQAG